MSHERDFNCIICMNKLPTITKKTQGYSDYGSGISERTLYDTSVDAYFVSVFNQVPFLRPYIEAANARFVDEEAKLVADINKNILLAEYKTDVLNARRPIIEKKCQDDIKRFSDFASEFARPFENCIYQPRFAVHASEPACIDKIMEISGKTTIKKRIVEEEKKDKMIVGEIILDVDTVIGTNVIPMLSASFDLLKKYMEPAKTNMLLNFMHFSEFKK